MGGFSVGSSTCSTRLPSSVNHSSKSLPAIMSLLAAVSLRCLGSVVNGVHVARALPSPHPELRLPLVLMLDYPGDQASERDRMRPPRQVIPGKRPPVPQRIRAPRLHKAPGLPANFPFPSRIIPEARLHELHPCYSPTSPPWWSVIYSSVIPCHA